MDSKTEPASDLYNNLEFWERRRVEQKIYIRSILLKVKAKSDNTRKLEIHKSALDVEKLITQRIKDLSS